MKGREVAFKDVAEMHKERLTRLARNLKRNEKRKSMSDLSLVNAEGKKFITLSSYNYKVFFD
jgi:hypothetical protein